MLPYFTITQVSFSSSQLVIYTHENALALQVYNGK